MNSQKYCCTRPGDTCTGGYSVGDARCTGHNWPKPKPVPRSETCNGKCPEDSPSNITNAEGKTICAQPWADKQCDPDTQYKCGNVCVGKYNRCYCRTGQERVTLLSNSPYYCCNKPGDYCTGGGDSDASCIIGTPLPRSEMCYGKCPEDSPSIPCTGSQASPRIFWDH